MFLSDRLVKGECSKCGMRDQYGDSCEVCGTVYQSTNLRNPYSAVSSAIPVCKLSEHYSFKPSSPRCENFLRDWMTDLAQSEATDKARGQLDKEGEVKLSNRGISRDAPCLGLEIPGVPGRHFYIWPDMPAGYHVSFKNLCVKHGPDSDAWTNKHSTVEQCHLTGKDILYFHTLSRPVMLKFSGHRTPTNVFVHGFLMADGAKMSKSCGTFITAQSYIDTGLNPEWLCYYSAIKLNMTMEDLDLNLDDSITRVNSGLAGEFVNIANRSVGPPVKHCFLYTSPSPRDS